MIRQFATLVGAALRQSLRDKSFFIFGIAVPLALMTVLNLVVGGAMNPELDEVEVSISADADDPAGAGLLGALGGLSDNGESGLGVTLTEGSEDEVRDAIADGEAGIGIIVPPTLVADATAGQPGSVTVLQSEGSLETVIVTSVVRAVVERVNASVQTAGAGIELGVSPEAAGALAQQVATGESPLTLQTAEPASEQLDPSAQLVAGQAGLFLIFTVGFGVLSLLTEREQGTLSRLRSMPLRPSLIVTAKVAASFILGLVATSVLLTAGSLLFDVAFGPIPLVALLVIGASAAATALMFIVIKVVRTAEQAGVAQSILAMVLGMAGGAFFPVAASGLLATVLDLNPIAAFVRGLGIVSGGGDLADLTMPLLTLAGFAALCWVIARILPNRGLAA